MCDASLVRQKNIESMKVILFTFVYVLFSIIISYLVVFLSAVSKTTSVRDCKLVCTS